VTSTYKRALAAAEEYGWTAKRYDWTTVFRKDRREVRAEWDLRGGLIYLSTVRHHYSRSHKGKGAILLAELAR
jgi:hypothetical protein